MTGKLVYWTDFDYSILDSVSVIKKRKYDYNNIIIMADTETSKEKENRMLDDGKWDKVNNYVVCWSLAMMINDSEYVMYGRKPSELMDCINKIHSKLSGMKTSVYFHNLAYDYQFLRKFFIREFGNPVSQLNVKPLIPLYVEYGNGLIIKDSLLLAQRKLEKWADDLDVEHKKAVGSWDYDKIRTQETPLDDDELLYIQNDVLAGVECLDKMCKSLNVAVGDLPYTNTGIVRREIKEAGKKNKGNKLFKKLVPDEYLKNILEKAYHGGFTHANRDVVGWNEADVTCYDFCSSYPYVILSERFPMTKFYRLNDVKDALYIISQQRDYAFVFKLIVKGISLKMEESMPVISFAKCDKTINAVCDNGRVLEADYLEIYITEQDLVTIFEEYDIEWHVCYDVWVSKKDYLPKWLRDKVFEFFKKKTELKGSDDIVAYNIAKGMLNSIYGLMCEHPCRQIIGEDYDDGTYYQTDGDYDTYKNSMTNVLLYQWGVWVTAYAQRNLFWLGRCCEDWLYCDTDSVYGQNWDENAVEEYNNMCIEKIKKSGYSSVSGYNLGVAEFDGSYDEFVTLGAKRYCCRDKKTGKLKITVSGVPKVGVNCLDDDIKKFKEGFSFPGLETGKKTHYYINTDRIWIDDKGNECGDCVDLVPCDYLLDRIYTDENWINITRKEITVTVYE